MTPNSQINSNADSILCNHVIFHVSQHLGSNEEGHMMVTWP